MGTILQLHPRERAPTPGIGSDLPARCEIVIFPGVRIERHQAEADDGAGRVARDRFDGDDRPRKSS